MVVQSKAKHTINKSVREITKKFCKDIAFKQNNKHHTKQEESKCRKKHNTKRGLN